MAVFTGLGSQASPSITFSADTNTGIFSPGADQVAIATGGIQRFNVSSTGEVSTVNEKLNLITVSRGGGSIGQNVAFGVDALSCNTTGSCNSAIGCGAMCANTTGSGNTAVGNDAFRGNLTGACNVAVGHLALLSNTSGNGNTAVGHVALRSNTTASNNTAVGIEALISNTTGISNVAIGQSALCLNTIGCNNTSTGQAALLCNSIGSSNTATGNSALRENTGDNNTAVGHTALSCNTTGCNNIGIGMNAGRTGGTPEGIVNITTEANRIVMGNDSHTCAQIKIAWTVVSDCRDKTCFAPIPHGLDFVRALAPIEYRFKEGGRDSEIAEEKRRYGFLAQDILPLEGDDPVIISTSDPDKLQFTEAHLIPVLVRAIQELAQRVQELENA